MWTVVVFLGDFCSSCFCRVKEQLHLLFPGSPMKCCSVGLCVWAGCPFLLLVLPIKNIHLLFALSVCSSLDILAMSII